jgi:hypothetical protein
MLNYPSEVVTANQKIEYLYKAQEKLRLLYNLMGKWWKVGITNDEYNLLPEKIRSRIAYSYRLTDKAWGIFQEEYFEPLSTFICAPINVQREAFKQPEITVDLESML